MKTFNDLKFVKHPNFVSGVQAKMFFDNGFGVSVISGKGSYGYEEGLYELAVLKGTAESSHLTYDTPVTEDVEGYLTPERVTSLMAQVQHLPNQE
jgi:hypothetical protein